MNEGFTAAKLAEGIWAIDEPRVRCFLVAGEKQALLIDSCNSGGFGLAEVAGELTSLPISLLLTHSDRDHTGGQDGFGVPLLHPSEYARYVSKDNEGREIRTIREGEILDLGGVSLEVVLIPGHTPGSVALLDRMGRRLFVGDTVSDFWIYMFGEGRDLDAFIESLKKLEGMTDCFDIIHPCHGSVELGVEWIAKTRRAAEKLVAGDLEGVDPPMQLPCKAYQHEGVTLLY